MKHIIFTKPHGAVVSWINGDSYQETYTTTGKWSPLDKNGARLYEGEFINLQLGVMKYMGYDNEIFIDSGHIDTTPAQRRDAVNRVVQLIGPTNCIHVELHLNADGGGDRWSDAWGHKVFYNGKFDSKNRAAKISRAFKSSKPLDTTERPIAKKFFSGIKCESFLIEQAFMTNATEATHLISNMEEWTIAIHNAIHTSLGRLRNGGY